MSVGLSLQEQLEQCLAFRDKLRASLAAALAANKSLKEDVAVRARGLRLNRPSF